MKNRPNAPTEPVLTYSAAKSLLEQAGIRFGISYTSETPTDTVVSEPRAKKSRASKSQQRREARNEQVPENPR